jgi:hypothetical protein
MIQLVELINRDKIIYAHDLMAKACLDQTKCFEDAYASLLQQLAPVPCTNHFRRRNLFEEGFTQLKAIIPKNQIDSYYIKLMIHFHATEMNSIADRLPLKSTDIMSSHDELCSYCVSKFTFYTPNFSTTSIQANLNVFSRETSKLLNELIHLNNTKIDEYNQSECVKLWNIVYAPKLKKYKQANELFLDLIRFKSQFNKYQFDSKNVLNNYFWMRFEQLINVKQLELQIKTNNY